MKGIKLAKFKFNSLTHWVFAVSGTAGFIYANAPALQSLIPVQYAGMFGILVTVCGIVVNNAEKLKELLTE